MATDGKDTLIGGAGDDTLRGELGDDTYIYHLGTGTDTIVDTGGADTLLLGDPDGVYAGLNILRSGNDLVLDFGTAGKLVLQNQLYTGSTAPASRIEYLAFEDEPGARLVFANGLKGTDKNDFIAGTASADNLAGGLGSDWLWGGAGNDTLNGGDGEDELHGGLGSDQLNGGAGDDYLQGDAGNDKLYGGEGHDDVSYAEQGAGIVLNLSGASLNVNNRSIASGQVFEKATNTVDTLDSIEFLEGTRYADVVVFGQELQNGFSVNLGQGNDTVKGVAGTGNHGSINVGYWDDPAGVIINLSDKVLTAQLGDTSYTVAARSARDGWGGTDSFQFSSTQQLYVQGSEHDDYIRGRDDTDTDAIWEWFNTERGNDTIDGGAGTDTMNYQSWDQTNLGAIVNLSKSAITASGVTLQAGTARDNWGGIDTLLNIENINGSTLADYLVGSDQNNNLQGGAGKDTLLGGAGNDLIMGGAGNDQIMGDDGNDHIMGDDGNDLIIGGTGGDYMDGGAGNDVFKFTSLADFRSVTTGADYISNFVSGEDKIDLSAIDANPNLSGKQAFTFFDSMPSTYTPGQIWVTGGSVTINMDKDSMPEYQFFVQLQQQGSLTVADFIL
jgi:Ca2+-binding RTX toxin-like protein